MLQRFVAALALLVYSALPGSVQAQAFTSLSDIAKVSILPGWRTESGTHMAAIRIDLAKGWKTYWRSPGDAGIPPQFDWQGSENLKAVKFYWPTPKVFTVSGFQSVGYKDLVVIPIELTPKDASDPDIKLRGQLDLGVCEDICVPMSQPLEADLGPGGSLDKAIMASLKKQPVPAQSAGVTSVICEIAPAPEGLFLTARIKLPRQGRNELAVFELPDRSIWIATAKTGRSGRVLTASTELVPPSGQPFALSRSDIRITVLGDGKAVDIQGCAAG